MKTSTIFAIGSAIAGCAFAGVKLSLTVKKCRKAINASNSTEIESSASYEEELAEIQAKHNAAMEALEKEAAKSKREHEKRMDDMRKMHAEKMAEMDAIRDELLKNAALYRFATPNEARKLEERDMELLKELREM